MAAGYVAFVDESNRDLVAGDRSHVPLAPRLCYHLTAMEWFDLPRFDQLVDEFDAAVEKTDGIDRFCSASPWILPAATALMPAATALVGRGAHGWLAAQRRVHPGGARVIEPLELAWGLASPLVTREPEAHVSDVVAALAARSDWDAWLVAGLAPHSAMARALVAALPAKWQRRWGDPTRRHIASLDGGLEGFLSRRSRNFRRAVQRARRGADDVGIHFEDAAADHRRLMERILAVEGRSWKGAEGSGLASPEMAAFYRAMIPRLAGRGALRAWFARRDGVDLGYVLGGVFAGAYRGLQFSFDDRFRDLSLGSLLQLRQIEALAVEGIARYDLGTENEYKQRWAEDLFETELLVVLRR